jgi:hypothetical protein
MNSVYESLRALLRNKELEIKRLEKEIEALRIVLPIVSWPRRKPDSPQGPTAHPLRPKLTPKPAPAGHRPV